MVVLIDSILHSVKHEEETYFHSFRASHGLICLGNELMQMHVMSILLINSMVIDLK